jgi:hypothetical protein
MKRGVVHTSVKILAVIYAGLLGLATILVAPLFLLGWGACEALREIVKAVRRAYSSLSSSKADAKKKAAAISKRNEAKA